MKRYDLIDTLRGMAVISMILYHACWIMNHFGIAISFDTLYGPAFIFWERSICIPFIIISGFSLPFGRNRLKKGLILLVIGCLITAATCLILPEIRIVFGILTFLGISTLLMIPADKALMKNAFRSRTTFVVLLIISFLLFVFTYNINIGYLGIPGISVKLPQTLYKGYLATFLGFMEPGFFSTDYFSLIPWFFLFACGYFLNRTVIGTRAENTILTYGIPGIKLIGRHSLLIYIIHPILLYMMFYLVALNA